MTQLHLIPPAIRAELLANASRGDGSDPIPPLKLFNPVGPGVWLITELDADGDTLFGLCDLDMGRPELGSVSLSELMSVRLPLGFTIERDAGFQGRVPLSRWAAIAHRTGSIRRAEAVVAALQ
jgi:hypothetical protein